MELPARSAPSEPTGSLVTLGISFPISKSSVIIEVSALAGDLGFNFLVLSSMDKITSSEFEQSSCSAPPDRAVSCIVVMVGVTMVGDSLSDAFTRNELLAERLAGLRSLGDGGPPTACFDSFLVSLLVCKVAGGVYLNAWLHQLQKYSKSGQQATKVYQMKLSP